MRSLVALALVAGCGGNVGTFSFQPVTSPTPAPIFAVFGLGGTVFLGADQGQIFSSSDGGATWTPAATGNATAGIAGIWGAGKELFAVGRGGVILHSTDGGMTFAPASSGTSYDLNAVSGSGPSDVFAAGANDTVLHWDGTSWTPELAKAPGNFYGVFAQAPGHAWVVGRAAIAHTANFGMTWSDDYPGMDILHGVWASSATDAWVAALGGILHASDGKSWSPVYAAKASIEGIWGSAANDVWAVGAGGAILRSTDGGMTWTTTASMTSADLAAVWSDAPNDVWVVGASGTVLHGKNR